MRTTRRTRIAIAALLAFAAVVGLRCAGVQPGGSVMYSWNDMMLVTSYTAKDTCSCLFVQNQTPTFCNAYTQASPAVANWTVDYTAKTVTATALFFWGAKARYVSPHLGCVVE